MPDVYSENNLEKTVMNEESEEDKPEGPELQHKYLKVYILKIRGKNCCFRHGCFGRKFFLKIVKFSENYNLNFSKLSKFKKHISYFIFLIIFIFFSNKKKT